MVKLNAGTALCHIRKLIAKHGGLSETDQHLLQRFISRTDQDAFATLVRRHGPMVLRVCREVLHEEHAAEDAFQATFLVLARKAASIRSRDSVGGWLRGVAQRVALKARVRANRHPECSVVPEVGVAVDPLASMTVREAGALLHEELQRLPSKYREPLCLCYFEGKTRDEAAQLLRWPLGTFNSRVDRARELLRGRLTQRGLTLSAALFTTLLSGRSATALPKTLTSTTVQAAVGFLSGQGGEMVSAEAVALAQAVLPGAMAKATVLAALLTVGLLGTAVGVAAQNARADKETVATAPEGLPVAAAEPAALVDRDGDPLPENALVRMGTLRGRQFNTFFVACLPDGKSTITASRDGTIRLWENQTGKEIRRFSEAAPPGGFGGPMMLGIFNAPFSVAMSPDGKYLAMARSSGGFGLLPGMPGPPPAEGDDEKPAKDPKPAPKEGKRAADERPAGPQPAANSPIRIWEVASGKDVTPPIKLEPAAVTTLAFSPDSKTLAVGLGTGFMHLYDLANGRERAKVGNPADKQKMKGVNGMMFAMPSDLAVAFSADGNALLVVEFTIGENKFGHTGRLWDLKNGKEIRQLKLPEMTLRVSLSPDSNTLAWMEPGTDVIVLWSTEQDKELRRLEVDGRLGFPYLTFSSDSKRLGARFADGSIHLWDIATGKETAKLAADRQGPENAMLTVSIQRQVDLAFSADGKTLVSAGNDSTIRVWDLTTNKERIPAVGHQGTVNTLALSADGKVLTTRGGDGTLRQWDTATGRQLRELRLAPGTAAGTFSRDGSRFAAAGPDNTVFVWDVAADKELWKSDGKVRTTDLAFSPDDKILATLSSGHVIQLWDTVTGKAFRSMQKGDNPAADFMFADRSDSVALMFSPDGRLLASIEKSNPVVIINGAQVGGDDPAIHVWNPATGKLIRKIELDKGQLGAFPGLGLSSTAIAFSPDNRMLASTAADGSVRVWELATGKKRFEMKNGVSSPAALAWSVDNTLALAGSDHVIHFLDVVSGSELGQFSGHKGTVGALVFAADGRTLYSGSADTSVLAWSLKGLTKPEAPEITNPTDKELAALWADLKDEDAAKAWEAINGLSNAKTAVAWMRDRVKPVMPANADRIAELVASLSSARFEERRKATEQLEALGDLAVAALQKALDGKPALETQQRLDTILGTILNKQQLSPEQLQALRALEVLERIGTAEAAGVLESLAKGAPTARLTREAQAALDRLKRQSTYRAQK